MAEGTETRRPHFFLEGVTQTEQFRSPQQGGGGPVVPARERGPHGSALRDQLAAVERYAAGAFDAQRAAGMEEALAVQVEFESFPDVALAFESLAAERSGIELMNVRHEGDRTHATVRVPEGKLAHFEGLIRDYLEERRDRRGRPRDHQRLIDAIREIRVASVRALWTDDPGLFPASEGPSFWWEVWLPVRGDRSRTTGMFRRRAEALGLRVAPGELAFPERTVVLAHGSLEQMQRSMLTLSSVAELRRAKETAEFFDSMGVEEQAEWLEDLLKRISYPSPGASVPHVCLLDTGVNRGHSLLSPALDAGDVHTIEPAWGSDDLHGHGTQMAGVALVGDLGPLLDESGSIELSHRLESVKLLPHDHAGGDDPRHHGHLTVEAVARPEVSAPDRRRVFGLAVTARDNRDRGRPSAWSSALDSLAADVDGYGANPRLILVSAGNIDDPNAWSEYPESNQTDGIHDPAQAWNAVTIGACTDLVRITAEDAGAYTAIAPAGGLSPFSTTSRTWQPQWPLKPDVVLEGGNAAKDRLSAVWMPDLSVLTAHHRPADRIFTTTNATSAATALGTRLAAQVMAAYPALWPETVRALLVHSAEWTDAMQRTFLPAGGKPSKQDYLHLLRCCGFGVPDLDRALWSVSNSLTMIVEEQIRPFASRVGKQPVLRDMHLHGLPWPRDVLESLGQTLVEMRVTLSYFIEPNPSERGVRSRYRYESHGLRFDVRRPHESVDGFRRRVNAAARDEEEGTYRSGGDDPLWVIGKQARHRGSLHADIWRGSAAELASRGHVAVYPALGWWKTRPRLERVDGTTRYALVISIRAPQVEVDLYNEVAQQIGIPVGVEV